MLFISYTLRIVEIAGEAWRHDDLIASLGGFRTGTFSPPTHYNHTIAHSSAYCLAPGNASLTFVQQIIFHLFHEKMLQFFSILQSFFFHQSFAEFTLHPLFFWNFIASNMDVRRGK